MRTSLCLSALVLLLFLPARADEPAAGTPPKENAAKKADPHAHPAAANLVVAKDPVTGQLRPATAAEREQLLGRRPLVSREREVVTLPDGTVMLKKRPEDAHYAVATRNADGTLSYMCVHGEDAARAAAGPAPPPAPSPAPKNAGH